MGWFSSDTERKPSRYEFRAMQRRLAELNVKCNGAAAAEDNMSVYAVTTDMIANKSPYEQDEVRLAMALKEFRDTMQKEAELRKGKSSDEQFRHPELTRLRQALRKQEMNLRTLQTNLVQNAKSDHDKSRAKEAISHLSNYRKRYEETKLYIGRSAFTTDDREDVANAGLVASPDRGDHATRLVVQDLDQVGNVGRNLREDEEFGLFFESLARNDAAMDAALDRIAQGVAAIQDNAIRIGTELKAQQIILDETQKKVEKTSDKLASLTIEYCFSNPSRYAYDSFQMTVTTVADVDFLIRVIRAKLPCLRTCRVDSRYYDVESASYLNPPKFDFSALFAVAVASPYLDRLVFDLPGTTQLLYQLIPQCFRDDDPHTPMDVEFKDGSLALRRRLSLVSLKAVIGRPRVENSPIVALKFFSIVFNVRRRNAMAYSSFLSDLIATLPVADHVEVPIPEAYINAAGESESENRYSTVDVRLAVLWMNDYADDEVHAVLTKSPTPRHHVSLVGRHFYNEHIKGPNGDDVLGMKRCVSLLALSHFLHIATLECLAASLLVSCASP